VRKEIINWSFLASSIAYKICTTEKFIENVQSAGLCGNVFQIPVIEGNKNIYEL
jgi:hypothetical protein